MQTGDRVGPFELLEVLGRGGMGEVWRAHDSRLDRYVALKTLPDQLGADAAAVIRLEREARLLAALNHPNIAGILGLEEQDGLCFLVLELIDGPTLKDRLGAGRLGLKESTDIALQVAEALQVAHARGIIHCDLKPSNIKVLPDGRIKVLDFGISRSLPALPQSRETTRTVAPAPREIAGTLAYMSPEQTRGEQVGPTSDIWAFGVLMYRMLTGELPFAGPTAADTAAQVLQSAPDLSLLRPPVPEALIRLVRRCLDKEPRQRIQNAGDLRFLIEEALFLEPTAARVAAPSLTTPPTALLWRWLAIATLGAAAAISGGLTWHLHGRTPSAVPATAPPGDIEASIAVLPFVNMSADAEQEYFSDGLTEELLNQLARIKGLRVTARTSSFAFKGRNEDVRVIGEKLGVGNILEGSVRKDGNRLRITAQLINSRDGSHLWARTYDRELKGIFTLQENVAKDVAKALSITLDVGSLPRVQGGTTNVVRIGRKSGSPYATGPSWEHPARAYAHPAP